jgi:chaperone BCS1
MAAQYLNESCHDLPLASSIPSNLLLESFIPGFSIVSGLLAGWGIDISSYVTVFLLFTAATAWLLYSASSFGDMLWSYFTSTVTIRMDDEAYNFIMTWTTKQPFSQNTRRFVAGTKVTSCYVDSDDESDQESDSEDEDLEPLDCTLDEDVKDTMIPWTFGEKVRRLMWTPARGTHFFRYRNQILAFTRIRDEKQTCFDGSRTEEIQISCLGRNGIILKELMKEAQKAYIDKDKKKTVIYRGKSGEDGMYWSRCLSRTPRPLSTITIDDSRKQTFIKDVKLYLHPATRRWYANRGIPYRRGYMFHGPPGTGKTSLAFALAGFFKLKIYMVNINSNTLTEDGLASLFSWLPRKCIALLEDVDVAGMTGSRRPKTDRGICSTMTDVGKCVKDELKKAEEGKNAKISLSGLLNVIDGVASQEGRILIMTTNHLDHLDPALVRPGRVDLSIPFGLADSTTVQEIFCRIYSCLEDDIPTRRPDKIPVNTYKRDCISSNTPTKKSPTPNGLPSTVASRSYLLPSDTLFLSEEQLSKLALSFSKHIPALDFTPAEIQGYLLLHRQDPRDAIGNVEAWVKETIDARKASKDQDSEDDDVDRSEEKGEGKESDKMDTSQTETREVKDAREEQKGVEEEKKPTSCKEEVAEEMCEKKGDEEHEYLNEF